MTDAPRLQHLFIVRSHQLITLVDFLFVDQCISVIQQLPKNTSSLRTVPSPPLPSSHVHPSLHTEWPLMHLKIWNGIPFSSPIDGGAVSETNGGFRKSILMKENQAERGKEMGQEEMRKSHMQ